MASPAHSLVDSHQGNHLTNLGAAIVATIDDTKWTAFDTAWRKPFTAIEYTEFAAIDTAERGAHDTAFQRAYWPAIDTA